MFRGFSRDMLPFMAELALRNNKSWYEAHKPEYRKLVLEPFYALTEELAPAARAVDRRIITEPRRCVSRARRDTRFTKDKSLYRNNIWISFKPMVDRWEYPMLYFEVLQDRFRCGLVYCNAQPSYMQAFRNYIGDCPNDFRQGVQKLAKVGLFPCGEQYKKPKPDAVRGLEEWFRFREIWFNRDWTDLSLLWGREFLPEIQAAFEGASHMYRILEEVREEM